MIGDLIRKKRIEADISQTELARRLNVCKQTISAWEMNRNEPKIEMIKTIAKALGCEPNEIVEEKIFPKYQGSLTIQSKEEEILLEAFRSATQEQRYQALLQLLKRGDLE